MAITQKKVKEFCIKNKLICPIEHRVLDLVSEVGEVSKEILKMSNYGKSKPKYKKELKSELGDSYFSLICVANTYDIDLQDALKLVLQKYKKRLKKGSSGSESDLV